MFGNRVETFPEEVEHRRRLHLMALGGIPLHASKTFDEESVDE